MKTIQKLLLFVAFMLPLSVFSQDVIVKKDGTKIYSKVQEISETSVKYKKHSNLTGPNYSVETSQVHYIEYENGTKDVFSNNGSTSTRSMGAVAVAAPATAAVPARHNPNSTSTPATTTRPVTATATVSSVSGTMVSDSRDGQDYEFITIGSQTWMKENLNFETANSICYGEKEDNCKEFGKLYTWEEAKTACPAGWHLPTDEEWQKLEIELGMPEKMAANDGRRGVSPGQGRMMKEGGSSGLDLQFGGIAGSKVSGEKGSVGNFWTASEVNKGNAWIRRVTSVASIYKIPLDKEKRISIRCIRD